VTAGQDGTGNGKDPADQHGRLPWFRPDELSPEQRDYYDRLTAGPRSRAALLDEHGRLQGAFNARLLDPPLGTTIEQVGAVLRYGTPALTGRQREIAILEVARSERSGYEWRAHSQAGLAAGLRPGELDALRHGRSLDSFDPAETLTRRVVQALVTDKDLDDTLFAAAEQGLGLTVLFDLISLVGYYQHTALALRVWRVPMDPDSDPFAAPRATGTAPGH
jgi:alkylhydroperoxidase family enzyme